MVAAAIVAGARRSAIRDQPPHKQRPQRLLCRARPQRGGRVSRPVRPANLTSPASHIRRPNQIFPGNQTFLDNRIGRANRVGPVNPAHRSRRASLVASAGRRGTRTAAPG